MPRPSSLSQFVVGELDVGRWDGRILEKRVFFVAGFREFIQLLDARRVDDISPFLESGAELVASQESWLNDIDVAPSKFDDVPAVNQLKRVISGKPVKFLKALQIIAALEVKLSQQRETNEALPEASAVYEYLQINPAIYTIEGLTPEIIDEARKRRRLSRGQFRSMYGVPREIIDDIYEGYVVSEAVALSVTRYFSDQVPDLAENLIASPAVEGNRSGLGSKGLAPRYTNIDAPDPWPKK